ncbi:ComF family protein [Thiomicrorhabdus xiamenensis]|uniref:ComF family protein n=1 Tax=Thiomicrorhabdus xiamenensis TaxID=2739063 RepID=A0A7D4SHG3_9GAMM|nr:ComF family protein [Thiomicrorhabdus xiamenensis]QKI88240.1 ComF family protein [Thiomicrorhabdus xiamenensis]
MHWLEAWLIPPRSVLSNAVGDGLDLSAEERSRLPRVHSICPVCAGISADGQICGQCLRSPPAFDLTQVAFFYRPPIVELIHDLKYHRQTANARLLAELYLEEIEAKLLNSRIEAIVPVPVHPLRRRERGYNQAELLARIVAGRLGLPVVRNAVRRVKNTPSQTHLDVVERKRNLRRAFEVDTQKLNGLKRLAIMDDVMTTGATIQSLAEQLKQQSDAEFIAAWVIAKTE